MGFRVFSVDIELEPNELDVAGVQGEGTLEVCIQYLRRGTLLGEGIQDEFNDHKRRVDDPDTVATSHSLTNLHAVRKERLFPLVQTLRSGQGRWNRRVKQDSRRTHYASHGTEDTHTPTP